MTTATRSKAGTPANGDGVVIGWNRFRRWEATGRSVSTKPGVAARLGRKAAVAIDATVTEGSDPHLRWQAMLPLWTKQERRCRTRAAAALKRLGFCIRLRQAARQRRLGGSSGTASEARCAYPAS